jgi:hypothetical protein
MKHFVVHNSAGEIIRAGICQDEALNLQAIEPGEFVVEGEANPETDAIDPQTGQILAGGRVQVIDMDYRKARLDAYPSVREQMDMLWHAMDDNALPRVEPFYTRLKVVKDAYPKDNSVVPGSVIIYTTE